MRRVTHIFFTCHRARVDTSGLDLKEVIDVEEVISADADISSSDDDSLTQKQSLKSPVQELWLTIWCFSGLLPGSHSLYHKRCLHDVITRYVPDVTHSICPTASDSAVAHTTKTTLAENSLQRNADSQFDTLRRDFALHITSDGDFHVDAQENYTVPFMYFSRYPSKLIFENLASLENNQSPTWNGSPKCAIAEAKPLSLWLKKWFKSLSRSTISPLCLLERRWSEHSEPISAPLQKGLIILRITDSLHGMTL